MDRAGVKTNSIWDRPVPVNWWIFHSIILVTAGIFLLLRHETPDVVFALFTLFLNVFSIYFARKNAYMLTIAIVVAYYNYSICMANYISIITTTYFTRFSGTNLGSKALHILFLFNLFLYLVFFSIGEKTGKKKWDYAIITNNRYNPTFVVLIGILLVLIWVFGFTRPEQAGQRGTPSTYFEYSLLLFILGFYYSGNSRLLQIGLSIIGVAYAGLNFMYGGRATGIQVVLCLLFCTVIDRIPKRWMVAGGIILFFLMSLIGSMRASFSLSPESISEVLEEMGQTKLTTDTAYSAYYTSMTFVDYAGTVSWPTRLLYFVYYLLSIVAGAAIPNSNLSAMTREYYMHYYGGVLPFYFYFYLGIAGIVVIAVYIWWLFSKVVKKREQNETKGVWDCIGIYIAVTSLRWYVYSPSQLIRGTLLLVVAFFIFRLLDVVGPLKTKTRKINTKIKVG